MTSSISIDLNISKNIGECKLPLFAKINLVLPLRFMSTILFSGPVVGCFIPSVDHMYSSVSFQNNILSHAFQIPVKMQNIFPVAEKALNKKRKEALLSESCEQRPALGCRYVVILTMTPNLRTGTRICNEFIFTVISESKDELKIEKSEENSVGFRC